MVSRPNAFSTVSVLVIVAFAGRPWITPAENARILAVETIAAKSHWNFLSSVIRSLTDAGHHVTMFTPLPEGNRENYTEVDMSMDFPIMIENDAMNMIGMFGGQIMSMIVSPFMIRDHCKRVYGNKGIAALMEDRGDVNFDLIVTEIPWLDCMSHLAHTLDLPIIYAIPSPIISFSERTFTGHQSNPACVAHMMARQAIPKTFVQRLENTALLAYSIFMNLALDWSLRISDPQPYDLSPTVSPSIIFQNSHYITEASKPIPPNIIDIGGIHLKPPKIIPKDILDFLEDAPNGVIYFTFGSLISFSTLPEHILETFKDALAQVPQKVLWKFEGELKNKPKNVMIKKWFPQREVLLHPNVKLFIGHGGMSGVYEAVDAGVPILGFPLFFDQSRNIEHLIHYDMAISMDLFSMTQDKLLNSISELINNDKYLKNAKINSQRFKDRPITPAQLVVYWTEYVIRHKGAAHLRSHGLKLTWYQYFLLDVIAVMLICCFLFLFIVYKVFKCICRCFFKSSQNVKVKSQ